MKNLQRVLPFCFSMMLLTPVFAQDNSTANEQAEEVVALADAAPGAVVEPNSRKPELAGGAVGLRIRFGMKDADPTDWSGKIALSEGKITELRGWHWAAGDHADGTGGWTVHTRSGAAQTEQERKQVAGGKRLPINDNGVVLRLDGCNENSQIEITTGPGKFSLKLSEIPYGKNKMAINGNFEIERTPVVTPLAATWADEDYPTTVVGKDGTIYVAWLAFTRGKDFQGHRERMATPKIQPQSTVLSTGEVKTIAEPNDFAYLAQPTGGM